MKTAPQTPTRRTGRPSNEDLEARRPFASVMHGIEGAAFGALAENLHCTTSLNESRQFDAAADLAVDTVEVLGWLLQAADLSRDDVHLIGRAIVEQCRRYRHADGLEDGRVESGHTHASLVRTELHVVTGTVEQWATGRVRGQQPKRPLVGSQLGLPGGLL